MVALLSKLLLPVHETRLQNQNQQQIQKNYDKPETPYQRLIASGKATPDIQRLLHQTLNPFKLKKTIERKLSIIFKSIKVTSNVRLRV
jgi:hypothetical protein